MKILLAPEVTSAYVNECESLLNACGSAPEGLAITRDLIRAFNTTLVKLDGLYRSVQGQRVDGYTMEAIAAKNQLDKAKTFIELSKELISARISKEFDPYNTDKGTAGIETLRTICVWYTEGGHYEVSSLAKTPVAVLAKEAVKRKSRQMSFDITLATFRSCNLLGQNVVLATVLKEFYGIKFPDFFRTCFRQSEGESNLEAAESLMAALNVE